MPPKPRLVPYLDYRPRLAATVDCGSETTVIGRATIGKNTQLASHAVLRADGHQIDVGADCVFLERATVHISDGRLPALIGDRVTLGRYALAHACTIGDDCVLADGAVVMDGSVVGPRSVIAAGALIPPGKTLPADTLVAGNPARPVRALAPGEHLVFRDTVRARRQSGAQLAFLLPPLDMSPYAGAGTGPLYPFAETAPRAAPTAFVAGNAAVRGDVSLAESVSVWFATVICADGAKVEVGPRSNVQDNSILATNAAAGPVIIGADVTIGHNVRMGACRIGDDALIGMGAEMADDVVVEEGGVVGARALLEAGTIVKAGHIWAGRPAREFRPVREQEREFFRLGCEVYVGYTARYLEDA